MHSIISSESASNNMDNHCTNADCLTFGELVLVTLDRVPAKYYNHLARFKSIITQLPETNAEITTFSDFIHTYDYIKTKLAAYLSEQEYRVLNENEAYIKSFVFNIYVQYFT